MDLYLELKDIKKEKRINKIKEQNDEEQKQIKKYVDNYNSSVKNDRISYEQVKTIMYVGISLNKLRKILMKNKYSNMCVLKFSNLFTNPYVFSKIYPSILTYKQSEKIEIKLSINNIPDSDKIESFIIDVLTTTLSFNNDTYLSKNYLGKRITAEVEKVEKQIFENKISGREKHNNILLHNINIIKTCIDTITTKQRVYFDRWKNNSQGITLMKILEQEVYCQHIIKSLSNFESSKQIETMPESTRSCLGNVVKYTEEQTSCFMNAINFPLSIICGGPGTGKTAIICSVNHYLNNFIEDCLVINLAFCGKAVRNVQHRLHKYTNSRCYTLHKFLLYEIRDEENKDNYNECVVIVDESSMVDLNLFTRILEFVEANEASLVLVGDDEQLPPIGIGNPFQTIINCVHKQKILVPYVKLMETHRFGKEAQKMLSDIKTKQFPTVSGSYYLKENKKPILHIIDIEKHDVQDFIITKRKDDLKTPDNTLFLVAEHNGIHGTICLNRQLQKYINDTTEQSNFICEVFNGKYYNNDKVLRTSNNYSRSINRYNGDEGVVIKVDKKNVRIKYWNLHGMCYGDVDDYEDKSCSPYEEAISIRELKDEFQLGYCRTIHKSQGGEATNVVIIGPVESHYSWTRGGNCIKLLRVALSRVTKGEIYMYCNPRIINQVLNTKEFLSTTNLFNY